ncbi:L-ribulose-5-phosphate 4-epimerase [Carnobacteriaceae bacterium zg-ZUI78]|nr:L-ribulose-5-phosphate 4-epimerase [Carnobacteriaceae bacterium zg-ZUI78]
MLENLRERVYQANCDLPKHKLVKFTWGNVSAIDRETGLVVIKPSGVDYEKLSPENMVITDLNGNIVEGTLRPSSDLKTHLEIYKAFHEVGGIVHTHSSQAVAWAQAGRDIPFYGTTHADYFYGSIPCARSLTAEEINGDYEKSTGDVIIETFHHRHINPMAVPGVIVRNHGPFTWGKTPEEAVYHSVVLEEVADMAKNTELLCPNVEQAPQALMDKHYLRKHGKNAYYGQK